MTFTIDLTPEETRRLVSAQTRGINVTALFKNMIADLPEDNRPQSSTPEDQTLALLAQWREEDATDDAEKLERRDTELEEFKTSLQQGRVSLPVSEV